MSLETNLSEARRQIEICNACRYCEGFCSVFPAMTREKSFADGDLTHLANLCHNCRGCYYSCQYTEPHEFALNIPAVLAEVRQDSWERLVGPARFAQAFHRSGVAIAAVLVLGFAVLMALIAMLRPASGEGFYAELSHNLMVALFAPAFLLPLVAVAIGLKRYWAETGAPRMAWRDVARALQQAGQLKNLAGGQGQGCNFEREDRYSNARRWLHQAVMYGFLLCFAATSVATLMHYLLGMAAPYPLFSLPKMFGITGGVLLVVGTIGLAWLKTKADPELGAKRVWGGEMGFIALLGFTAASGLALYAATGTGVMPALLVLHLGAVATLFVLLPYTKMVHGFFRLTALIAEEAIARRAKA